MARRLSQQDKDPQHIIGEGMLVQARHRKKTALKDIDSQEELKVIRRRRMKVMTIRESKMKLLPLLVKRKMVMVKKARMMLMLMRERFGKKCLN